MHAGAVTAIEGPNEVDNSPVSYNGLNGVAGDTAFENALVAAARGTSSIANVSTFNVSSANGISTNAGFSNFHAYPTQGAQPLATLTADLAASTKAMPGKPAVLTEAGYYTMANGVGWGGVDYTTQAKLTLNMIMDATKLGVSQVYIYQLLDDYADPKNTNQEDHFGLFDVNNAPKPAATAIHNLTAILSDTAASAHSFTTSNLAYTITGLPGATGSSFEMEEVFRRPRHVCVWNEPKIWNNTTHSEIAAAASNVTVNLGASYANVSIYDPLSGTSAIQTLHNTSAASLWAHNRPPIDHRGRSLSRRLLDRFWRRGEPHQRNRPLAGRLKRKPAARLPIDTAIRSPRRLTNRGRLLRPRSQ